MISVPSPCILVCVIEQKSGYCYGCGRTRDEIAQWSELTADAQRALVRELPVRVAGIERKPRRETKRRAMVENQKATN